MYKKDNRPTVFHWSSTVSGGLASLWAFCQKRTNHHVRKCCVKSLMLTLSLHWPDSPS